MGKIEVVGPGYIAGSIKEDPEYKKKFKKVKEFLIGTTGKNFTNPAELPDYFPKEVYIPLCFQFIEYNKSIFVLWDYLQSEGTKKEILYAAIRQKNIYYIHPDGEDSFDVSIFPEEEILKILLNVSFQLPPF